MPKPPKIDGAPGLAWRARTDGWTAVWIARAGLAKRGYVPKTQRLWLPIDGEHSAEPTAADVRYIQSECTRLQDEMLIWARGGNEAGAAVFNGTVASLTNCYCRDPDSPFQKLRFASKRTYGVHLDAIEAEKGERALSALTARDFLRWFDEWAAPADEDDCRHVPRAHARMTMVRLVVAFGATNLESAQCKRIDYLLGGMKFEQGKARDEELTAAQANDVRRHAHEIDAHSIALAQAFQFELQLRPKDVVGECLPLGEPGLSDVTVRGMKWLYGIDWREISDDLMLKHRLSKSLRGRSAIADPRAGKVKTFNLRLYPMIMEELARIPAEQRTGPLIKNERTGLPYVGQAYGRRWRTIANAVGIPKNVQNRDTRAGAITEGIEASNGDMEAARNAAGHSKIETTQRYNRGGDRQTAKIAVLRAESRKEKP